ncbi:MAG: VanZ family protein [Slackia sp.]
MSTSISSSAHLFSTRCAGIFPQKRVFAAPLIASLYGVTDEIHQIFVPTRSCDPADWAVDTVAAIVGAILAYAVIRRLKKTKGADKTPTP